MYKIAIYKRAQGCTHCAILDRILPEIKASISRPDIQWDEIKIGIDNPDNIVIPPEVTTFPTTLVFKDGQMVGVVRGYADWKNSIEPMLNQ